ncbi:MAG: SPASM domain-containing protein [Actinomycetota bacterium]|nr:SPASM domain-containing protein [Actinomycetota bacterium]
MNQASRPTEPISQQTSRPYDELVHDLEGRARAQLDLIWNVTPVCPWNCAGCCVAALHVKQKHGAVLVSASDLSSYQPISDAGGGSLYDKASRHLQRQGIELTLASKLQVLENVRGHDVRLDVSGGDVLSVTENLIVLQAASSQLGRENVTLTATGVGLVRQDVEELASLVGEMNFTFDGEPDAEGPLRPSTYAMGNLRKAKQFAAAGVSTRAECPLSAQNLEPEALARIYLELHEGGIDKLLLMRHFPVGRGQLIPEVIPSNDQYRRAISILRELEARYGSPTVKLQCALRLLEGPSAKNPCDALTVSFGLLWDGTLLGSPWAINKAGRPIDEAWVLGNLATTPLGIILQSEKTVRLRARASENHGQCKIFSWLNGTSPSSEDRIFEHTDPMYAPPQSTFDGAA